MKILFVCSSNICRSPYCEFMFKRMVADSPSLERAVEKISSAAVFNQSFNIHAKARLALKREGFSDEEIDSHKPRYMLFAAKDFFEADIIIGMNKFNKFCTPIWHWKKFKTLSEVAIGTYKDVPDPFLMKDINDYYAVMDVIKDYLVKYKENLLKTNN